MKVMHIPGIELRVHIVPRVIDFSEPCATACVAGIQTDCLVK